MPIFRVEINDTFEVSFEEIYRAWRTDSHTRVYEVEAENEEDAEELAEDYGTLVDEDWENGDIYDSEWYDSGEVLSEDFSERDFDIVEIEVGESKIKKPEPPTPDWRI